MPQATCLTATRESGSFIGAGSLVSSAGCIGLLSSVPVPRAGINNYFYQLILFDTGSDSEIEISRTNVWAF